MSELKTRVEELRDQVARLTEANRAMVGDAELVNTAMMAELDAMRASRRADMTEVDAILAELQPHVEEQTEIVGRRPRGLIARSGADRHA